MNGGLEKKVSNQLNKELDKFVNEIAQSVVDNILLNYEIDIDKELIKRSLFESAEWIFDHLKYLTDN